MTETRDDPLNRLIGKGAEHPALFKEPDLENSGTKKANKGATKRDATTSSAPSKPSLGDTSGRVGSERINRPAVADAPEDVELQPLSSIIDRAREFAEQWEPAYRTEVFRIALTKLLALPISSGERIAGGSAGAAQQRATSHGDAARLAQTDMPGGGQAPVEKLARALGLDPDAVERAVAFADDGKVAILGRVEGASKRELQTKYALAYLYIKEMAFGIRMVAIEELRALCVEQGCYDLGNFTANFKKDILSGLLREQGEKGARVRRYLLSQKGLSTAADVLREMVTA